MRIVYMAIIAFTLLISPRLHAAENVYFIKGIADLPILTSMVEIADETALYDKPEGRIVSLAFDYNATTPNAITGFYHQTLPSLGWQHRGIGLYTRGHETLHYAFDEQAHIVTIKITPRTHF